MKQIFFAVIAAFIAGTSYAQLPSDVQKQVNNSLPRPVPTSPDVAALGKFGDYQVSHFSGIPDISIPLYTVEQGELKVPITLSYHASGIKPTDISGWVGTGWALSAGGNVSRSVNGEADEDYFSITAPNFTPSICTNFNFMQDVVNGTGNRDTQPDVYGYSFPGHRGNFLRPYNEPAYLIPQAPIVINPAGDKFIITDEAGIVYRFGYNATGTPSAYDYTNSFHGGSPTTSATTAWHLTDMTSSNGADNISFTYQSIGTAYYRDVAYSFVILDVCETNFGTCPQQSNITNKTNTDSDVAQKGLQNIYFKNGKIEFILGSARLDHPTLNSLDRINIYNLVNGTYTLQRSVQFIYSYFMDANNDERMLKLDAVLIKGNLGDVVQRYNFTYFTNTFSWNPSHVNFVNARDYWGYYNGAIQNTDLLLHRTVTYQQSVTSPVGTLTFGGGVDRAVNTNYIKEGVLKRIDFPTGGYTEFDFESNQYNNSGIVTNCGGLRVKKISSYDGTSANPIVKTYKYAADGLGGGKANFIDNYFNYMTSLTYEFESSIINEPDMSYQSRTYNSSSALTSDPFDSSPVFYPYVTEYTGDVAGVNLGKTIYIYDGQVPSGDMNQVVPASSKYYRSSYAWQRGNLTYKGVFDKNGNKVTEDFLYYDVYKPENGKIVGIGIHQLMAPPDQLNQANTCINENGQRVKLQTYMYSNFTQNTGAIRLAHEQHYAYQLGDQTKSVLTETWHSYDTDKIVKTQQIAARSDGEQIVTVNRYPFHLAANVNSSSTGAAQGIYIMNQKNIIASPIETWSYAQRSDNTNKRMISGQVMTTRQNSSNATQVVADKVYVWESDAIVNADSYIPASVNSTNSGIDVDSNQKPRVDFISYDENASIQNVRKINDTQLAYKYGYGKKLPVAEVVNAYTNQYQTTQTVQSTGTVALTLGGPWPGTISGTYNFTPDYTGTAVLRLSVPGNPSYSTIASYSGITSGSATLVKNGCELAILANFSVTAGVSYSVTISLSTYNSGVTSLGACGSIDYPKYAQVTNSYGTAEFYYEGFEESPSGVSNPTLSHTGDRYFPGDFTVSYTRPNTRSYLIEYWYLDGSNKWQYISKPYNVASMILNEGSAIDDIRIYPKDARMKTYTHTPGVGMTSVISESGQTQRFEYDGFGRLKLIRDDFGNILKTYQYHYKSQN
jgi:YD repeat-containing protein